MNSRPISREVYWRRRFLVLAVLFALIWGVLQIVGMIGGDVAEPRPTTTTEPPAADDAEPTEPEETDDQDTEAETESEVDPDSIVPVSLVTVTEECEPENLRIQPMVPAGQRAGAPVTLELLVTTLDAQACTFTPSAKDLLVVIEANNRAVYDSAVCREAFLDSPVVLARSFGTLVRTTWNGRGSGAACNPKEGFAPGGSYTLNVGTYGGEPGTTDFSLKKAAKKETAEPKAKKSDTDKADKDADKDADKKKSDEDSAEADEKPTEPGND